MAETPFKHRAAGAGRLPRRPPASEERVSTAGGSGRVPRFPTAWPGRAGPSLPVLPFVIMELWQGQVLPQWREVLFWICHPFLADGLTPNTTGGMGPSGEGGRHKPHTYPATSTALQSPNPVPRIAALPAAPDSKTPALGGIRVQRFLLSGSEVRLWTPVPIMCPTGSLRPPMTLTRAPTAPSSAAPSPDLGSRGWQPSRKTGALLLLWAPQPGPCGGRGQTWPHRAFGKRHGWHLPGLREEGCGLCSGQPGALSTPGTQQVLGWPGNLHTKGSEAFGSPAGGSLWCRKAWGRCSHICSLLISLLMSREKWSLPPSVPS